MPCLYIAGASADSERAPHIWLLYEIDETMSGSMIRSIFIFPQGPQKELNDSLSES